MNAPTPGVALTQDDVMRWTVDLVRESWVRELRPNDSPRIREYQRVTGNAPPDSWCMSFQWWGILHQPWGAAVQAAGLRVSGSCEEVRQSAKRLGWLQTSRPIAGDVGLLIDTARDHAHHTFLVIGTPTAAWDFPTCEGNTNPAGGREGYGVFCRKRTDLPTGSQYEFIRIPRALALPAAA